MTEKESTHKVEPKNCAECEYSEITTINKYLRCKLTGNCYVPSVMVDKISEVCPLGLNNSDKANSEEKK